MIEEHEHLKKHKPIADGPVLPDDEIMAGIYLYLLRLNKETWGRVEAVLRASVPCDFDPRRAIALPVRGSDKCNGALNSGSSNKYKHGESDCLPLEYYLEVAEMIRRFDPQVDTIILTSEDRRFVEARANHTGRWRFVVNSRDVMQGTGEPAMMEKGKTGLDMDQIFLSMTSTLHLQMRAKYFILNCGSNFHFMLRTLVERGGCSYTSRPAFFCMEDQVGLSEALPSAFRPCPPTLVSTALCFMNSCLFFCTSTDRETALVSEQ
jgi:hypothetical protein